MTKIFFCGMIGIRRKLAQEIDTESHEKAEKRREKQALSAEISVSEWRNKFKFIYENYRFL